jgi:hypothetical protein
MLAFGIVPGPVSSAAVFWWLVLALAVGVIALTVYVLSRVVRRYSQFSWPPERTDDGIRVGAPKVYDNRSLSLMLEEPQNQLKALQNIDAGPL